MAQRDKKEAEEGGMEFWNELEIQRIKFLVGAVGREGDTPTFRHSAGVSALHT